MKFLRFAIAAVFIVASQAAQAPAFSTATPYVKLSPLSPSRVAVAGAPSSCDRDAAVDGVPYLVVPEIAAQQGVGGTAQVKIDLTSAGKVAAESLFTGSGNKWLDNAALVSAKLTQFTPEVRDCQPIAGSYLYEVRF
jgi:TonB family protein